MERVSVADAVLSIQTIIEFSNQVISNYFLGGGVLARLGIIWVINSLFGLGLPVLLSNFPLETVWDRLCRARSFFSTFFESFLDQENHGQDVKCGPKIHPERLKKFLFAFLSLSLPNTFCFRWCPNADDLVYFIFLIFFQMSRPFLRYA